MCGRFAQVVKYDQLKKYIDELVIADRNEQLEINYNVAPTNAVAAVIVKQNHKLLTFFRWGLIPSWSPELPKFQMINIRAETIAEKPTFRNGLRYRRCLIPANGFYEWRKKDKQPFFIHSAGSDILWMAGIYDTWTGSDGSFVPSCGIITTQSNSTIAPLHDRMPVLINTEMATWLDPNFTDTASLRALLVPANDSEIAYYPVSKTVNRVGVNLPECMEQIVL
ncbi:MAG: DUF159 family protein [Candidatus Cloacimonetes bacterium HGW-Cloacimonetes-1]|jgi:putative SOS response-associated peptidase YedK|nr:MAG: DUF159 family protein [Candidatus Cloacimonetes bacterium HGW-Cloacimonetes-1]